MEVQVSELRRHLAHWLRRAEEGEEIAIRSGIRVITQLTPARDEHTAAVERLAAARARAQIGDIVTPVDQEWEAER